MDFEIDRAALAKALLDLGIDPDTVPDLSPVRPPPLAPPYQSLSDFEWACIERHIAHAIRLMRPREAARSFIENLLICEHSKLSTRYLPDEQEATRQRALRWSLDGRLEKLCADLREDGQLSEDRLTGFDTLAKKAKATRERVLGSRAVRLIARLDKPTES
jgi:transposase